MGANALEAEREKNGDPTLYEEMEWLNARFVRIYRRKGVSLYGDDGKIRWLESFLLQERKLGSHSNNDSRPLSCSNSTAGVLQPDAAGQVSEREREGKPLTPMRPPVVKAQRLSKGGVLGDHPGKDLARPT
jgi:hypothetical protein